jgi:cation diffusion facilitator family transporter
VVISFSALFILYEAFVKILHPREMNYMNEAIGVMVVSILITAALVYFLNSVAKKTGNMVIKADALHYKTDLFSNGAILFALALISITAEQLIDPILGVLIAVYMIYSAVPIIKEGILMLLDAALSEEDIQKLVAAIESEPLANDYHDLKTRASGSHIFLTVHIVFNDKISLVDAHAVTDSLEEKFQKCFEDKTVHALIHMDPYDDSKVDKKH